MEKETVQLNSNINQLENAIISLEKGKSDLEKKLNEASKEKENFTVKS